MPLDVECCKTVGKPEWSVWQGGALLSETEYFRKTMMTRQDWNEYGPSVIYKVRGMR